MSLPVVTIDRLMPSETETGTAEGFWLNLSGRLYDDFEREGMQGFVDKLGRYCLVFNSYEDELEEGRCARRVVDELLCRRVPFSVEFYRGPKGPSDADRVYWRRWESHIDITRPEVRVIRAHLAGEAAQGPRGVPRVCPDRRPWPAKSLKKTSGAARARARRINLAAARAAERELLDEQTEMVRAMIEIVRSKVHEFVRVLVDEDKFQDNVASLDNEMSRAAVEIGGAPLEGLKTADASKVDPRILEIARDVRREIRTGIE
eukprot:jgi/Mesvir1/6289/Mv03868-RA.1